MPLEGASYSISSRIAVDPQAGRKTFTLQTVPAREEGKEVGGWPRQADSRSMLVWPPKRTKGAGWNGYAGTSPDPAVSTERMALTNQGNIRYTLKTPYRDGTTHIILEPLDFIARLAALVPKPRVNLTRFHGVFAPNSSFRAQVTPAKRGRGGWYQNKTASERQAAMTCTHRA